MKKRAREPGVVMLELYYDTTVEPFASPPFSTSEVLRMLKHAKSAGIAVRIVDTAGWSRDMLMEQYRAVMGGRRIKSDIFGPKKKRGWFFGREVPALVIYREGGKPEVYPSVRGDQVITISNFLKKLLTQMEVMEHEK